MPRSKKCRNCGESFTPKRRTTETACSIKCAISLSKEKTKKNELRRIKRRKEDLTTKSDLEKKLQDEINAIVRKIDHDQPCISCGGSGKAQAGHYHSVGSNNSIRFHLMNIWKQEANCNTYKGGNVHAYDLGIIELLGRPFWEAMKFDVVRTHQLIKLSRQELVDHISKARSIKNRLEAKKRSLVQRVSLRVRVNEEIGIYLEDIDWGVLLEEHLKQSRSHEQGG